MGKKLKTRENYKP